MFPAFDRYAGFTDLAALNEWSSKPLRKSVRVNTLKSSVEAFQSYAKEKKWTLTPVPWCPEAFYIERENREDALGKDLLHLLGHVYMQEAASMLPPALLEAQPGDHVLDMSAAPGSKTTQMGARMLGKGVIVANDVQEKRLWTLKSSLHRCGVHNNLVTKKVGQWFARHMTERFDKVLCDAPCTAQGTVRKDSDALEYCSLDNIEKMARLQYQLLESAIHSTKVGGRIVYSTCTLTPEENEGVVMQMLEKFQGQVEVVDPRELRVESGELREVFEPAVQDSIKVQRSLSQLETHDFPFLRLWPQTYDTEGFFCAVLQKTASTRAVEPVEWMKFQEKPIMRKNHKDYLSKLEDRFGTTFFDEGDALFERGGESVILATCEVEEFGLAVEDYALGIPFAKKLKDGRLLLDHEMATLRGHRATKNVWEVDDASLALLLDAKDCDCRLDLHGHTLLLYRGFCIGQGLAKDGRMKNNLPRWMVRFG
jgi:16S rRNA (cytosine1407-C5)-methyltransferase